MLLMSLLSSSLQIEFFFSSRRRHTRLQGDWSSDVCSSDLLELISAERIAPQGGSIRLIAQKAGGGRKPDPSVERSEERRVGKGRGTGRVAEHKNERDEIEVQVVSQ